MRDAYFGFTTVTESEIVMIILLVVENRAEIEKVENCQAMIYSVSRDCE